MDYMISYKSNLERLKTEVGTLENTKNTMQDSVDKAKINGEEIENDVLIWLRKLDPILADAKKLIDNDVSANVVRRFPNLWVRHQQSKKFQKMAQVILQVLAEGKFDRISYTKQSKLKEIQELLTDSTIFKIGLYGTEGVGKTTLVKELASQVEKDGSFDAVVMAEVTDSTDAENIQDQIANALGLKFDEETKEERVEQLHLRIKKENSILVILDNISGKLDLAELGIPFGDDHQGCKLLLTSENHDVLKRQMGTQKDFRLEVLSDNESWKLLEKIAGNYIEMNNIDQSIAQDVAKCCDGLPLFIVVVAKALQTKGVSTWEVALNQLKRFDKQGLLKESVCPLELGYNYLENDELKKFFLFIVLFGLDRVHSGELFSNYWGFYKDLNKLTEARKKYYKLVNDLRASSLLLEDEIEYVRMHDVVREMAKAIASRSDLTYEVRKFTQMEQWDNDQLQRCHYINLPLYNIDKLPDKLDCPNLKLMSLRRNHGYLTIPDNFFSMMKEVKVLNLHGMRFARSPTHYSLHLLANLISLNLYGCVLEDIAIVAKLTKLEILTIERSKIQQLPKEIGQLVSLRMLNLTNCYQLKTIPANLLSSLTRLEEIYMGNCDIQWEVEGGKDPTNNASLSELKNLKELNTLELSIQDASVLPVHENVFGELEKYNIFIGNTWKWSSLWSGDARENSKILKLDHSLNTNNCLNRGVQLLLTTVEHLSLAKLNSANDVSYELNERSFPKLRHLYIQNSSDAFRNLETLILHNLHNLEGISYNPVPTNAFEKLQVIKVQGCYKLKKLLLYSLAKNLSQLRKMEISECEEMKEIIYEEKLEDKDPKIMLPNLHSLTLDRLYKLRSFSFPLRPDKDGYSIHLPLFDQKVSMPNLEILELSNIDSRKIWDDKLPAQSYSQNLQHLGISRCNELVEIFVQQEVTFPNLETLFISVVKGLKSIWNNQQAPNSFCKLNKIQITRGDSLHHVFPVAVAKELPHLQVLVIWLCDNLETIVEESHSRDTQGKIASTKLEEVEFEGENKGEELKSRNGNEGDVLNETAPSMKLREPKPELEFGRENKGEELKSRNGNEGDLLNETAPSMKLREPKPELEFGRENKGEELKSRNGNEGDLLNETAPSMKLREPKPELEFGRENKGEELKSRSGNESDALSGTDASMKLREVKPESGNKGDASSGEIIFMKLKELELYGLPRLTSFCKATYNFEFPALEKFGVISCPNMKTFSRGNAITPILSKVQYTYAPGDELWESDLNTTLKKIAERN